MDDVISVLMDWAGFALVVMGFFLLLVGLPVGIITAIVIAAVRSSQSARQQAEARDAGQPPPVEAPPGRMRRAWLWLVNVFCALIVVYVVMLLVAVTSEWLFGVNAGWRAYLVIAIAMVTGVAGLFLLAVVISETRDLTWLEKWRLLRSSWRYVFWRMRRRGLRSLEGALRTARAAANTPGRLVESESLIVWTDMDEPVEQAIATTYAKMRDALQERFGWAMRQTQPLRVICFAQPAGFVRFFRWWVQAGEREGMRLRTTPETLVLNAQVIQRWSRSFEERAAEHLAEVLVAERPTAPEWVQFGMRSVLIDAAVDRRRHPGIRQRVLAAAQCHDELASPDELVSLTGIDRMMTDDWQQACERCAAFAAQSATLMEWVLAHHRDALGHYV